MQTKEKFFLEIESFINNQGLRIKTKDQDRPWGGFYVIEESDAEKFIQKFFPEVDKKKLLQGKLSPKILLVAPEKKLSWQYHFRRAEVWKLIKGIAGIVRSETDEEKQTENMRINEVIELKKGERHRLVGLSDWGVVAEIWIHTDINFPSDEDDIVRLKDDFGR